MKNPKIGVHDHHTDHPHHRQAAGGNRPSEIVSTWPFWNPWTHRLPRPHGDWQAQGELMSNTYKGHLIKFPPCQKHSSPRLERPLSSAQLPARWVTLLDKLQSKTNTKTNTG